MVEKNFEKLCFSFHIFAAFNHQQTEGYPNRAVEINSAISQLDSILGCSEDPQPAECNELDTLKGASMEIEEGFNDIYSTFNSIYSTIFPAQLVLYALPSEMLKTYENARYVVLAFGE